MHRQTIYPEEVVPEWVDLLSSFYGVATIDLYDNNELYRCLGRVYNHDMNPSADKRPWQVEVDRTHLRKIDEEFRRQGRELGSVVLGFALRIKNQPLEQFLQN